MDDPAKEFPAAAPSAEPAPAPPLRGSVIHFSRTRNRFKIVPEGKLPHEAVFLPLAKMNSSCDGGCAVDATVSCPVLQHAFFAMHCLVETFDALAADYRAVACTARQVLHPRHYMPTVRHPRHKGRCVLLQGPLPFACQARLLQGRYRYLHRHKNAGGPVLLAGIELRGAEQLQQ